MLTNITLLYDILVRRIILVFDALFSSYSRLESKIFLFSTSLFEKNKLVYRILLIPFLDLFNVILSNYILHYISLLGEESSASALLPTRF